MIKKKKKKKKKEILLNVNIRFCIDCFGYVLRVDNS